MYPLHNSHQQALVVTLQLVSNKAILQKFQIKAKKKKTYKNTTKEKRKKNYLYFPLVAKVSQKKQLESDDQYQEIQIRAIIWSQLQGAARSPTTEYMGEVWYKFIIISVNSTSTPVFLLYTFLHQNKLKTAVIILSAPERHIAYSYHASRHFMETQRTLPRIYLLNNFLVKEYFFFNLSLYGSSKTCNRV